MALIKLTAIVDNISGKLNGTVFARNKGGHYMRSKSNPTNPKTASQMNIRSFFGSVASAWRDLPQNVRNAWNNIAPDFPYQNRMGDTKIYSGFNLFMKLQQNLQLIGNSSFASIPSAPVAVSSPTGIIGSFGIDSTGEDFDLAEIQYSVNNSGNSETAVIYATAPLSAGINNFDNRLRMITAETVTQGTNQTVNIKDEYKAKFGVPKAGQKIGFAVRIISNVTGQGSVQVTGSEIAYED